MRNYKIINLSLLMVLIVILSDCTKTKSEKGDIYQEFNNKISSSTLNEILTTDDFNNKEGVIFHDIITNTPVITVKGISVNDNLENEKVGNFFGIDLIFMKSKIQVNYFNNPDNYVYAINEDVQSNQYYEKRNGDIINFGHVNSHRIYLDSNTYLYHFPGSTNLAIVDNNNKKKGETIVYDKKFLNTYEYDNYSHNILLHGYNENEAEIFDKEGSPVVTIKTDFLRIQKIAISNNIVYILGCIDYAKGLYCFQSQTLGNKILYRQPFQIMNEYKESMSVPTQNLFTSEMFCLSPGYVYYCDFKNPLTILKSNIQYDVGILLYFDDFLITSIINDDHKKNTIKVYKKFSLTNEFEIQYEGDLSWVYVSSLNYYERAVYFTIDKFYK